MTHSTIAQKLRGCLGEALEELIIQSEPTTEISVDDFRTLLRLNRSRYAPVARRIISSTQLKISNPETETAILETINTALVDYIKDGQVYSAVIGHIHGKQIEKILRSLLVRAIADGPEESAQALVDCTTNASCMFYDYVLITGVRISAQVEVTDGITLIPLPDSFVDFPAHIPAIPEAPDELKNMGIRGLEGKTLVRVEYEISPILHRPEGEYTIKSGPERHFKTKMKGGEHSGHELDILFHSLSLVGGCCVESVMAWDSYTNYEVFDTRSIIDLNRAGYITRWPGKWSHETTQFSELQLEKVRDIYVKLTQDITNLWKPLSIPIDRWIESLNVKNEIDQIIDLGIALESLYVENSNTEVKLRLAIHGAWHLGVDKSERKDIMKTLKTAYDARSKVVHTGRLGRKMEQRIGNTSNFIWQVQELCRQGITKIIDDGQKPSWNEMILGED